MKKEFDDIAIELDKIRKESWKPVVDFTKTLKKGSLCLDLGCGNGRDCKTLVNAGIRTIGVDISDRMLEIARKNVSCSFIKADVCNLPILDDSVDNAVCIAVLHHLGSESKRLKALTEIKRCLKKNGRCMISVWIKKGLQGDKDVKWIGDKAIYYHFFAKDELLELIKKSGLKIEKTFVESNNLYVEIKK